VGCAAPSEPGNVKDSDLIAIAREYVAKNLPEESRVLGYRPLVVDRGALSIVTFIAPGEPRTGGVPEIYIDKKSRTVQKVERAQ
jgi:hypothetical protein